MLEDIDSYDFYCALCGFSNTHPIKKDEYNKINRTVKDRVQNKLKSILKRAKKYKCYVL